MKNIKNRRNKIEPLYGVWKELEEIAEEIEECIEDINQFRHNILIVAEEGDEREVKYWLRIAQQLVDTVREYLR